MASVELTPVEGPDRRRPWTSARGAELVELAMVLPILLAIVGGVIDFGFMFQRWEVVTNAAREGARIRVLPGYSNADAIARANAYLTAAGLTPNVTPSVSSASISPGAGAPAFPAWTVTVSYNHQFTILGPIIALLPGGNTLSSVTLTGTSTMRSEVGVAP